MKKILLLFVVLSAQSSNGQSPPERKTISVDSLFRAVFTNRLAAIGKPFPEFSVMMNNKPRSNKDLEGKVVFVNLWFAACPPCMAEMDALNDLYEKFKADSSFEFVSFTFDDSASIAAVRSKYNIRYNIYRVSSADADRLNLGAGFPTNVVLDKNVTIRFFRNGGQPNKKTFFSDEVYPAISKELKKL